MISIHTFNAKQIRITVYHLWVSSELLTCKTERQITCSVLKQSHNIHEKYKWMYKFDLNQFQIQLVTYRWEHHTVVQVVSTIMFYFVFFSLSHVSVFVLKHTHYPNIHTHTHMMVLERAEQWWAQKEEIKWVNTRATLVFLYVLIAKQYIAAWLFTKNSGGTVNLS